jgi:hypothetical protein
MWTALLVVLFKYRFTIPRAKTQGLVFIGCAWQWPYRRHCFVNSDFLQGENTRSLIGRQQHLCIVSLLEASFLENPFCSPGVVFCGG